MSANITILKNIQINQFRGLKNVLIPFGSRITVICGKNGTSKSTILGVIAQAFSFRKDYSKTPIVELSKHKTLTGGDFESVFSDHFRLSEKYDTAGSMDINISVYDGAEKVDLNLELGLYKYQDRPKPRPIIRGNTTSNGASSSRNVTHPLIFLSLKRLMPIALRTQYTEHSIAYLKDNADEFKALNNALLNKTKSVHLTATKGTINSVVVHGNAYDKDSVSAGEDNTGQILQALFSFKNLKSEYTDYHGGILLVDEADAGLFPAAQVAFIKILAKEAKKLNLQVIMTSHSPTMIEQVHKLSQNDSSSYKTIYLTDTFGAISVKENISWPEIYADLHIETIVMSDELSLPKINTYFEDREAYDFFSSLIKDSSIKKTISCLKDVKLGCENYKQLMAKKIPEFSKKGIIVFDGDVQGIEQFKNALQLPGILPPDQLIFEFLYNLPDSHEYWKNEILFTKPVFLKIAGDLVYTLGLTDNIVDLKSALNTPGKYDAGEQGAIRVKFKKFYQNEEFQKVISGSVKNNPFRLWVSQNKDLALAFRGQFISTLKHVLSTGHGIDSAKVSVLFK